jgi:copper transport protein
VTAIRLLLILCAAFLGTLQASSSAIAHASLIRSDPADGSVLAQAPERFVLTFNEPVSPLVLRLVEANGTATALDKVKQVAASLDIEPPGHLSPGTRVLSWRVVSEDGHPISGAIIFSVGEPSATPSRGGAEVSNWPLRIAIWGARVGLYVGLFFGIGGGVFRAWIGYGSRYGQGFALTAMVAGLLSIVPAVGLQGVDALAVSFAGLGEARVWLTSLKTSFGITAVLASLALLLGLVSVRMEGKAARVLSAAAVLGAGSALAASGHASTAPPQWLTRPALFVHVMGVSIWAGALVPLAFLLASRTPAALASLRRFSKIMPLVVAPLIAAGLVLAVVQVKDPGALFGTAYGRILAVKLALVFVLLTLAGINRWLLTGPAGLSDPGATRLLRRSTLIETILVAAILGVVALWRFTPPPPRTCRCQAVRRPHPGGERDGRDHDHVGPAGGGVCTDQDCQSGRSRHGC